MGAFLESCLWNGSHNLWKSQKELKWLEKTLEEMFGPLGTALWAKLFLDAIEEKFEMSSDVLLKEAARIWVEKPREFMPVAFKVAELLLKAFGAAVLEQGG